MKNIISFFALLLLFASCDEDTTGGGGDQNIDTPKLSISSVTLFEGNADQVFTFTVNASKTSDSPISVDYNTEEVSAGIDDDFIATSGTLTIPVGETRGTIEVTIIADEWREGDDQFKVVLSNPVGATITNGEGIGTIRNDDEMVQVAEDGYSTPLSYPGLTLTWNDEFEGNSINTDNWCHEMGNHGWGNNELQNYTDSAQNSFIDDGKLVIEAREESSGGSSYSSARMITLNKHAFAHGRIDIRAIIPEGQGVWPALWMLGDNFPEVGWPNCGEIDIMELVGHEPHKVHGTAHWGPQGQSFSNNHGGDFSLTGSAKFSDEFNVFSIIWTPGRIEYLVNDNRYFTLNQSDVSINYPFDLEFFFIFNVAVGGNWPGSPDNTTQFPQRMVVDYIRVFQ